LLVARRALKKLGLDTKYQGTTEPDGTVSMVEPLDGEDAPRPFKCFLDVGLRITSTGAKVFAAMKGASDGGIYIPHSETRFPGYDRENKSLDSELLRDYIYGESVAEYMRYLEEEDEERYKKQFARFIEEGISADDLEEIYEQGHAAIRADPSPAPKKEVFKPNEGSKSTYKKRRLTFAERRNKIKQKKAAFEAKLAE
jgi:large subunit ribosomal protein L5e